MNCRLRFWERQLSRLAGQRGMLGESVCPILEEDEEARTLRRQGLLRSQLPCL